MSSQSSSFNVKDYGAQGIGGNDTSAIQNTINAALASSNGGTIYFPTGNYGVFSTLTINSEKPIEIAGDGLSSNILWAFNGHLFQWVNGIMCLESVVRDLKITAQATIAPDNAAFYCSSGAARSTFSNLLVISDTASETPKFAVGSGIFINGVSDSLAILNCLFWNIKGDGIRLGHGSEIVVMGGRIIGYLNGQPRTGPNASKRDNIVSIGIHLTGNNGGIYLLSASVIDVKYGLKIDNTSGAGSNREVFLTHCALDSCYTGLLIEDTSYVSITGCWAASCTHENISVQFGAPTLVISGGTVYNAGQIIKADPNFGAHGMIVNSGSFQLCGVAVRYNTDIGIWVPNASVNKYSITGCRINNNGRGVLLGGSSYICTNNIFAGNANPNQFLGADPRIINNNIEQ